MSSFITRALEKWLAEGKTTIGEVAIRPRPGGGYELCHVLDAGCAGLEEPAGPVSEAAREIGRYDEQGHYRPLKTAPNLRRGWRLAAANNEELHDALDALYPAMLAAFLAWQQGRLRMTPLRETLARQSGMYAVTRRLTDEQAARLIPAFCNLKTGCLKRILWPMEPGAPASFLPAEKRTPDAGPGCIPLLCAEACNLLVAKAREVVKGAPEA